MDRPYWCMVIGYHALTWRLSLSQHSWFSRTRGGHYRGDRAIATWRRLGRASPD